MKIEAGKSYIVKRGFASPRQITVVAETKTCYKISWNNNTDASLMEKKEFDDYYKVLEEVETLIVPSWIANI